MQIFDNVRSIVKDDLEQTIAKGSRLSIAAATFSIYAYQELRKQLEGIDELRFIFTSQTFTTEQARKERKEFYIPRLSRERSLYGSEFEIKLRNELSQKAIAKECADWIRRKVSFRSNVTDESMNSFISIQEGTGEVHTYQPINGFTTTDLGVGRGNNATNIVVRLDSPATDEFLRMFDTIWGDSARLQDVTDVVLDNITAAYRENSPDYIYFVALYNIFNEFLEDISEDVLPNDANGFKNSVIWGMLYNFQRDAVLAIINKLERYNGCIFADSVGLGKTFTALAVIKYYELRNKSVLVLCPKKLSNNWNELRELNDDEKRASVCGVSVDSVRKNVMGIVLSGDLENARRKARDIYEKGCWPMYYFTSGGTGGIAKKTYLKEDNGRVVTNLWQHGEVGHTDEAKKELLALFDGKAPFDTPKPTRLIERIIAIAADKDDIIMDFFSGSASTAQAVISANAKDGGRRHFILVQLPEQTGLSDYPTLCDVGEERIRRCGDKIASDAGILSQGLDIGFRVLRLDESNMKPVYYAAGDYTQNMLSMLESNIEADRNDLDLLFGCLIEWGLPLSLPFSSEQFSGCSVHTYNDGDLIACFDESIPETVIREIASRQPLRVVFRDSSFASSPERINVEEIFKLLSPNTSVKVL